MKVSFAIAALLGYTSAIQLDDNNVFSQTNTDIKTLVEKQMKEEIKAAATTEEA